MTSNNFWIDKLILYKYDLFSSNIFKTGSVMESVGISLRFDGSIVVKFVIIKYFIILLYNILNIKLI